MRNPDEAWIIIDLDGTLADCSRRIPAAMMKDWEAFHADQDNDPVVEPTASLLRFWRAGMPDYYYFMLLTGRPERYRVRTLKWLVRHELFDLFDELVMRPEDNYIKTGELKLQQLVDFFGTEEAMRRQVKLVIEDREACVIALRTAGLTVWAVNEGNY